MNSKKLLAKAAENWPAKALSLALAIALFVFHNMSALEERFLSVPLNVEGGGNLIPSKPYPRTVLVRLKGDKDRISPIVGDDIEAYLDLRKYEVPGDYRAEVLIRKRGNALGVETLEITVDPTDVDLSLDNKTESEALPSVVWPLTGLGLPAGEE